MEVYHTLTRLTGFTLLILITFGFVDTQTGQPGVPTDYCQWQDFEASCNENEVIVVTSAKYGRMQLNECVKRNYGYLGCGMDVLPYLDWKCSGTRHCKFEVFDDTLRQLKPCPEDIAAYLQATHTCLQVSVGNRRQCQQSGKTLLTDPVGYIASAETMEHGYGDMNCPWQITVQPGQRLNFTLFNFARGGNMATPSDDSGHRDVCYELAEIREPSGGTKRITLCDGLSRESSIYISASNSVILQFVSGPTLGTLGNFLLKYEATGCPNLKNPDGGWLKREKDDIIVRCNKTGQTRYLTCKGTSWVGDVGNCTDGDGAQTNNIFPGGKSFPYGILLVVAIGVALGVFFGGLLLSIVVVYIRRRQKKEDNSREMEETYNQEDKYMAAFDPELHKRYTQATTDGTIKSTHSPLPPGVAVEGHTHTLREADLLKQTLPYGHVDVTHKGNVGYLHRHIYESPQFS